MCILVFCFDYSVAILIFCFPYLGLISAILFQLDSRLNKKLWLSHLTEETENYWLQMIDRYLVKSPSVVIRGVPSIAEATRLEEEEKQRIEARKLALGEEQLKVWQDRVENAKLTNEVRMKSL